MGTVCVVTEPCHDCKYTDCVAVCPTECFYQDEHMLYIDPDECICCLACITECPVEAIFEDDSVPSQWQRYIELNAERAHALKDSGHITETAPQPLGPRCQGGAS
jgi:ferredoxin